MQAGVFLSDSNPHLLILTKILTRISPTIKKNIEMPGRTPPKKYFRVDQNNIENDVEDEEEQEELMQYD
jgi:hypothetical protein